MKVAFLASLEDRLRRSSFFFPVAVLAAVAHAQSAVPAPEPAPAPCSAPAFHAFDFWIGDWDVYDAASNQLSAHARIVSIENGCALREEYRALDDGGGESLSAWDDSQHQWRQHWVSSGGAIVSIAGNLSGSSMILTGPESGTHAPDLVRGTWTPEHGGVREVGERSTDGGRTWQPWFDLHFRPSRSSPPRP